MNLDIESGYFYTLLGPSGCGKTTILKLQDLNNLMKVKLFIKISLSKNYLQINVKVNTVFQDYALFPHLNVYENIAFGLRLKSFLNKRLIRKLKKH